MSKRDGGRGPGAGPLAGKGTWDLAALNFHSLIHLFQHGLNSRHLPGTMQGSGDSVEGETAPGWALEVVPMWKDYFNAIGIENNYFTLKLEGLQRTLPLVHSIDGQAGALGRETTCPSHQAGLGPVQTLESELCPLTWTLCGGGVVFCCDSCLGPGFCTLLPDPDTLPPASPGFAARPTLAWCCS